MARTIKVDLRSVSPFRQPSWRWRGASELFACRKRARRWEDRGIADAARYLNTLTRRGEAAAQREWPALSAAYSIYTGLGVTRNELEARLVARESHDAIAAKTEVSMAIIAAYTSYFFDVPAVPGADGWLLDEAVKLIPGLPVTEGQIWKYLAMAGGPVLVDLLVDDFLGRPSTNPDVRSELAAKARYIVREYATDWNSVPAVRAIVQEGCQLFSNLGRSANGTREERLIAIHLKVVRMAAGLESLPEHEPESSKPGSIGARKDNSHGRPQQAKPNKAAPSTPPVDQEAKPDPQAQAEARRAKSVQQAYEARHLAVPAQFSAMVGAESLDGLGAKFYMDIVKLEAGKPTDPIERMLLEQIMLAHHHIAMLHTTAATSKTTNEIKVHYGVLARLMGEFRRFALAIRIYRQPATQKSFSVVKQQNVVANGEQTVTYVTGAVC